VALGFQLANGKLIGPADLFDDPAFDYTRWWSLQINEWFRRHGPFEPHRVSAEAMEYTTLPKVLEKLKDRWKTIGPKAKKAWASGELTEIHE